MGPGGIGTESLDGDSRAEIGENSNTHKLIGELGGLENDTFYHVFIYSLLGFGPGPAYIIT